ncbi:MAG: permease [Halapricum sp.]
MNPRYFLLGLASAVTTFLLAGAVTIEILSTWYGEGPGVGILGVAVGVVVALLVGTVVTFTGDRLSGLRAAVLVAYGAFGVAFLAIAGMSYVNVPGVDEVFTFPVHLAASLVVAILAAVLASRGRGPPRGTSV